MFFVCLFSATVSGNKFWQVSVPVFISVTYYWKHNWRQEPFWNKSDNHWNFMSAMKIMCMFSFHSTVFMYECLLLQLTTKSDRKDCNGITSNVLQEHLTFSEKDFLKNILVNDWLTSQTVENTHKDHDLCHKVYKY